MKEKERGKIVEIKIRGKIKRLKVGDRVKDYIEKKEKEEEKES